MWKKTIEEIHNLSGWNNEEIAKEIGVHRSTISRLRRDTGEIESIRWDIGESLKNLLADLRRGEKK